MESSGSEDDKSMLDRLQRYHAYLKQLQSSGSTFFSDYRVSCDLIKRFHTHDLEEDNEGHLLLLQTIREGLRADELSKEFSALALDEFLVKLETAANLLSCDKANLVRFL